MMECEAFGADVRKLDGLISDCGRYVGEHKEKEGWFEVSTLKEPYRIEGKKTMAYELWEQFSGGLPDVIIYPTGGGVGLIGMCKAFEEMETMGWIGRERPRMVAVQATGCAPIVGGLCARGSERAAVAECGDDCVGTASAEGAGRFSGAGRSAGDAGNGGNRDG